MSSSVQLREVQAEASAESRSPLVEAKSLTKHFKVGGLLSKKVLHAVDDVDLVIYPKEIVALVGESGSGKSTVARLLARVYNPTSGEILFRGKSFSTLRLKGYREQVQMVFQDPYSSLNPFFRASHGVTRSLKLHSKEGSRSKRRQRALELLESVGFTQPRNFSASILTSCPAVSASVSVSPKRWLAIRN